MNGFFALHPLSRDIEGEIWQRNARFRAWQAYGVPVEARWQLEAGKLSLLLRCLCCQKASFYESEPEPAMMNDVERAAVVFCSRKFQCAHLTPLLRRELPPDVKAILDLELLCGP